MEGEAAKLPTSTEWTWVDIGESRIRDNYTLDTKLFCGEMVTHQTWAIVKIYPDDSGIKKRQPSEVIFINEYPLGDKNVVVDFDDLALMYPLQLFKRFGGIYAMKQLKMLILYLYLQQGKVCKILDDFGKDMEYLSSALTYISNDHHSRKCKFDQHQCCATFD